jgi:adenylate kinase family enzyme
LAHRFKLPLLVTGELLRTAGERKTDAGRQAKAYMDAGQHVPEEILFGSFAIGWRKMI